MPYTPTAVIVDPAGNTCEVTIKRNSTAGVVVDAYTSENGSSLHSFPKTVTTRTVFWLAGPGAFYVELTIDDTEAGSAVVTLDPYQRASLSPSIVDVNPGDYGPTHNPAFTGTLSSDTYFGVGAFTPGPRVPFATNMLISGTAVGTSGTDVTSHALQTGFSGDFTSMGGPDPGQVWGMNVYTYTGTAAGDGTGLTALTSVLGEVALRMASGNIGAVYGMSSEVAFVGAQAGGHATSMRSFVVRTPKRKDSAVGGTTDEAISLYIEATDDAILGTTTGHSWPLYVERGLSHFGGPIEVLLQADFIGMLSRGASGQTLSLIEARTVGDTRVFHVTPTGAVGSGETVTGREGQTATQVSIGNVGPGLAAGVMFGTAPLVRLGATAAGVLATDAATVLKVGHAVTGSRPAAATVGKGAEFYDDTLSMPIWSNGTVWKDAAGNTV